MCSKHARREFCFVARQCSEQCLWRPARGLMRGVRIMGATRYSSTRQLGRKGGVECHTAVRIERKTYPVAYKYLECTCAREIRSKKIQGTFYASWTLSSRPKHRSNLFPTRSHVRGAIPSFLFCALFIRLTLSALPLLTRSFLSSML